MIGWWLALAAYLVGYMATFRRIAGQLAWHYHANPTYSFQRNKIAPTAGQWGTAISFALGLALIWPISLPIAHSLASARLGAGLFYIPPKERERIISNH